MRRPVSPAWGVHPFSKVVPIRAASRRFFAREMDRPPSFLEADFVGFWWEGDFSTGIGRRLSAADTPRERRCQLISDRLSIRDLDAASTTAEPLSASAALSSRHPGDG